MNRKEAAQYVSSFFGDWYPALVRYATRASGSLSLAEDLAQEALFQLYQALAEGRQVEHPKAWTLCVVRREVGHRRASDQRTGLGGESFDEHELGLWSEVDPVAALTLGEVYERFHVLSTREEEVLLLRLEGLRYREIAHELGLSTPTVSTLLARAVCKLQAAMQAPSSAKQVEGVNTDASDTSR
jgi:RNA polymerase sigma factor (sigma-70 family)